MGSGLILLVIVGAWLAVLVPMGLRAHGGTPLGADPGPEAGDEAEEARVLPRRRRPSHGGAPDGDDVAPDDSPTVELHLDELDWDPPSRSVRAARRLVAAAAAAGRSGVRGAARTAAALRASAAWVAAALRDQRTACRSASAVSRRRRVLTGLLAACALTLALGVLAAAVLLPVAAVLAAAAALHLVRCRHAVRRGTRHARRRPAPPVAPSAAERYMPRRPAAASDLDALPAPTAPAIRSTGPALLPAGRPVLAAPAPAAPAGPLTAPAPATPPSATPPAVAPPAVAPEGVLPPAALTVVPPLQQPARVRGALGEPWQPVPVPLPLYLRRPAPRTSRSAPRPSAADLRGAMGGLDQGPSPRRRASGDW